MWDGMVFFVEDKWKSDELGCGMGTRMWEVCYFSQVWEFFGVIVSSFFSFERDTD